MNNYLIMDAISYLDADMLAKHLERKEKLKIRAIRKKKVNILRWGAIAAVFCLVLTTSFVMMFNYFNDSTDPNFTLPTSADNILWLDDNTVTHDDSSSIVKWNEINVSSDLYEVLDKSASDKYIAIIVKYANENSMNDYVFSGKSYAEHIMELDSLRCLSDKYEALQKEGELLKYGELLYTEGLLDGTKWTKTYYDERVSYYGTDILSTFIVDGVFLSEQLESSIDHNQNTIIEKERTIFDLIKAYDGSIVSAIIKDFGKYSVTSKNGNVYLFITPSELKTIDVVNIDNYSLYFASRAGYEDSLERVEQPTEPMIKDNISGFAYNKIIFDSLDTQNSKPTNDATVISMLNEMIEKWRYTHDCVEFTFYYDGALTEEDFEEMQYVDILQTNYPARMIVKVKYADINMEALKELSQKTEITAIHISAPSGSFFEPEPEVE